MMKKEVIAFAFLAAALALINFAAAATSLTSCGSINSAGIYTLQNNVSSTGTCFTIDADNVVLDCQGKAINYSSSSIGYGILARNDGGRNNITIKNCTIMQTKSSGICQNDSVGIYFDFASSACSDVNIMNNRVWVCGGQTDEHSEGTQGMAFRKMLNSNIIGNNVAALNGPGIMLTGNSRNCIVRGNNVNSNGHAIYFHVNGGVYDSIIEYNNVSSSNWAGVYVHGYVTNNIVRHNIITNSDGGIGIEGVNTTVFDNSIEAGINQDRGYGIRIFGTNHNVSNNRVSVKSNGSYGLMIWSGQNISVTNNSINARGNCSVAYGVCVSGIWLRDSASNNTIKNNNIITSGINANGVYLQSSSINNTIVGNTMTAERGNGMNVQSCSNNNFTNNSANNGIAGIVITSSNSNIFKNNTASYNQQNGIKLSSSSTGNSFNNNTACYNNQANGAFKDVNDADAASFIKQICDTSNKLGICLSRCTPQSYCCNVTYIPPCPSYPCPKPKYFNGWYDLPCEEFAGQSYDFISNHIIKTSPYENCTAIEECPVNVTFAKFTQELKLGNNAKKNTSINWFANFLPDTTSTIITDKTPIATSGKDLLELAKTAALSNASDQNPEVAARSQSPYKAIWPSQEHIEQYLNKSKNWFYSHFSFLFRPTFEGPFFSVWDNTLQRTIYGSAWGIKGSGASTNITPVSEMALVPGMPYFVSPDNESNVTWVGRVPKPVTFELKKGPVWVTSGADYIVLPLYTKLTKAANICNNLSLPDSATIGAWDVETQWYLLGAQQSCASIKKFPTRNFDLQPGGIYYVGGLTEDITWTQE